MSDEEIEPYLNKCVEVSTVDDFLFDSICGYLKKDANGYYITGFDKTGHFKIKSEIIEIIPIKEEL